MIRPALLSALVLLIACTCVHHPVQSQKKNKPEVQGVSRPGIHVVPADVSRSLVFWKGTKFRGMGFHKGSVLIKSGQLLVQNQRIRGGHLIIDMSSIYVTDIPVPDSIPRTNLTVHLKNDFDVAHHPWSRFKVDRVVDRNGYETEIHGYMTIRDITRPLVLRVLTIQTKGDRVIYFARTSFSRKSFQIGAGESWLKKESVDDRITIDIRLVYKARV